ADQHIASGRVVVAHDAFDQRRFSCAVLAEESVERARLNLQLDIVERGEVAEPHGHGNGFDAEALVACVRLDHAIASIKSADLATAPNTPPCILIIFSAWS